MDLRKIIRLSKRQVEIDNRIEKVAQMDKAEVQLLVSDITELAVDRAKYLAFGE